MNPAFRGELVFEQRVDHAVAGDLGFRFEGVGGYVNSCRLSVSVALQAIIDIAEVSMATRAKWMG